MKKITSLLIVLVSLSSIAQHTFSIVAVDPATGEIGSAGATCLAFEDGALAISDIILNTGAIHTQSAYLPANQNSARDRMEAGDSPQEIIDFLVANDAQDDPSARQYNIVDLNAGNPRSAAFTGPNCFAEFIHITGPNYAIAGNILISEDVVTDMETAFVTTTGTLADKLMAAMQGAKRPGADARCLSDGVSSLSAFLRVADPSDTSSDYGDLSLDLNVWVTGTVFEPIDALQSEYDNFLGTTENEVIQNFTIFPNPANHTVTVRSLHTLITQYEIVDITGKIVRTMNASKPMGTLLFDVDEFTSGIYFLNLYNNGKKIGVEKLIVN